MSELKLTKGELRLQKQKLEQLEKYLPILQLRKSLLQRKITEARAEYQNLQQEAVLLSDHLKQQRLVYSLQPSIFELCEVEKVSRSFENIAGLQLPFLMFVEWKESPYVTRMTSHGTELFIRLAHQAVEAHIAMLYAQRRMKILQEELRRISIRTNLVEKILLPKTRVNIKKILVFLGDMDLAAIGRSKLAKKRSLKERSENGLYPSV